MPDGVYSDDLFKGPHYALVIGISTYKLGQVPEKELSPKEFPNLKVARKDAEDFASFLEHNGFIEYNVRKLLDQDATLKAVKKELDDLRKRCRNADAPNPLVIIYFSGHGWADEEERHYLIPYDAERDELPGTALPNDDFSRFLEKIETNRMVVFIDACHAGAMAIPHAKGPAAKYSVANIDAVLGEGQGRYVIASCQAGQSSYELETNSIFTTHLLGLLKCETDDIEEETIDVSTLFKHLKKRVKQAALRIYQQEQEPTSRSEYATDIILAINKRVRERRIALNEAALQKRLSFFEAIEPVIKNSNAEKKTTIVGILRAYAHHNRKMNTPEDFYGIFDEQLADWEVGAIVPDNCCELLIDAYAAAAQKAIRPKESHTQERPKPPNMPAPAPAPSTTLPVSDAPQALAAPSVLALGGPQQEKRRLSAEDIDYVLQPLLRLDCSRAYLKLSEKLKSPVGEQEILVYLHTLRSRAVEKLSEHYDKVIERLNERWSHAEIVASTSLTNVMLQKGFDV
jgi:hypothetical protein